MYNNILKYINNICTYILYEYNILNKLIKQYLFFLCNALSRDGSRSTSLLGLDIGLSDPEFLMTLIRFRRFSEFDSFEILNIDTKRIQIRLENMHANVISQPGWRLSIIIIYILFKIIIGAV